MRQDYRQFDCARCQKPARICSPCDRGQRYCARGCAREARRESWRAAGKRYRATFLGRQKGAARQARYRQHKEIRRQLTAVRELLAPSGAPASCADSRESLARSPALAEKVTHQGSQSVGEGSKLGIGTSAESRDDDRARRVPVVASGDTVVCHFCGAHCLPIARSGPLRRRR